MEERTIQIELEYLRLHRSSDYVNMSPDVKYLQHRLEKCIAKFVLYSRVPAFLDSTLISESEMYFLGYWLPANLCKQDVNQSTIVGQKQSKTQLKLNPDRVGQATKVLTNILTDEENFQAICIKVFRNLYKVELTLVRDHSKDHNPLEIFSELKMMVLTLLKPHKIPTDVNNELVAILSALIEQLDDNSKTVMVQIVDWIMGLYRLPSKELRIVKIQDDLTLKKAGKFFSLHNGPNTYQENFLGVLNFLLNVNKHNSSDILFTQRDVNIPYICERLYASYNARFPSEDRLMLTQPFKGTVTCEETQHY